MEINLLPKRSPLAEYRFLIVAFPLLLLVGGAVGWLVWNWQTDSQISQLQSDLYRVQSDNIVLRAEGTVDSKTRLFQNIQAAVQEVQDKQRHDGQILDGIAAKLSSKTRVTSATMDEDKQMITLELQSDSVDNIADYVALLRQELWVQDVFVQNIKNTTVDLTGQQTQDASAKGKQGISFTTKVEITLAPTAKK